MPRYYFHVHDGMSRRDEFGTELDDLDTARVEAVKTAGDILSGCRDSVCQGIPWRMIVTDAQERPLLTLRFSVETSPLAEPPEG